MKKFFALACMAALIFAGTTFASPTEFYGGTINIPSGWGHDLESSNVFIYPSDFSQLIEIMTRPRSRGETYTSGKEAAEAMSKLARGTTPEQLNNDTYMFRCRIGWNNWIMSVNIARDGKLNLVRATDSKDAEAIVRSIRWKN